jgi:formylglycine-generating enzyme required for sulfatase activity
MKTRMLYLFCCAAAAVLPTHLVLAQVSPILSVQVSGGTAQLSLTGEVGSPCQLQYATAFGFTNQWSPLANITFLSSSTQVADLSPLGIARYYRTLTVVPSNMVWISAGTFAMGSPTNEVQRNTNELQHSVTLTKGFYMGKYLVTQGSYRSLMNTNPSYFNTNNSFTLDLTRPVEQVSWFDASNYCYRLTQQEQTAGRIFTNWAYRLPTESEWEYACRAGTTNAFCYGSDLRSGMANFDGEYEYVGGTGTVFNASGTVLNRTTSVGSYQPNNWGLFDTVGNVWEWCQDWFANYPSGPVTDPQGPPSGTARVFRGGALNSTGRNCRSAFRNSYNPSSGFNTVGFRVVLAYSP